MNRMLIVSFTLLAVFCFQSGFAQVDSLSSVLGRWYMAQRFEISDRDHDQLLSKAELEQYPSEWVYFLDRDIFTQVDKNNDQHLNKAEVFQNSRGEFSYRLSKEKKQIDLLGQQYKYFHSAKPKYLKRHPHLAQTLLTNYYWTSQHPQIIQQITNDQSWLLENPNVLKSLLENFRWLTHYSSLAFKLYQRKKLQNVVPEMIFWKNAHLKLFDQHPQLKKRGVAIEIPTDYRTPTLNQPSTDQKVNTPKASPVAQKSTDKPSEDGVVVMPVTVKTQKEQGNSSGSTPIRIENNNPPQAEQKSPPSTPSPKEWLEMVGKEQAALKDRLSQIQQGPDPLESLRDSVNIVVGIQRKNIENLYKKLSEQAKSFAYERVVERDSLRKIQWNLESELRKQELQLGSLSRERSALWSQNQKLKKDLGQQNRQIQRLEFQTDSLNYAHQQLSSRMALLMKEISELNDEYIAYIRHNGKIKDSLRNENTDLLTEIEAYELSLSSQQRTMIALRGQLRKREESSMSNKQMIQYLIKKQDSIELVAQRQQLRMKTLQDSLLNGELAQINLSQRTKYLSDSISKVSQQLQLKLTESQKLNIENESLKRTLAGLKQDEQEVRRLLNKDQVYVDSLTRISLAQTQEIETLETQVLSLKRQLLGQMSKNKTDMELERRLTVVQEQLASTEKKNQELQAELATYKDQDLSKNNELQAGKMQTKRLLLENQSMREQLDASQEFVRETIAEKSMLESKILNNELSIAQLRTSNDSLQSILRSKRPEATKWRDSIQSFQTSIVELEQQIGSHLKDKMMFSQQVEALQGEINKLEREKVALGSNKQINDLRFRQLEARAQDINRLELKNKEKEQLLIQREAILQQKISNLTAKEKKYQALLEKEKELKLLEQRLKQQQKKRE